MISSPVDGAKITSPVTVTYGFGDQAPPRERNFKVYLLVDQPVPQPGDSFAANQTHIAFPTRQTNVTATMAPGKHTLQLAVLNRAGKVGTRFLASAPVNITVK